MRYGDDSEKERVIGEYHHQIARKIIVLIACIIGIVVFVGLFSLSVYDNMTLSEVYEVIWN
ncbi:MAG: hypothetical protein IKG94_01020, partial [Candidatus Methanomethylophilaceae archaeon]|nr:hypothetical protein [Candidatus Methanomethylophilaceae archaeon]